MRLFLFSFVAFSLAACSHSSVGYRQTSYKEVPLKPMNQSIAEQLGSGSTVTVVQGPNNELNIAGSGFQFSSYSPFGNNWDFEAVAAFQKYSSLYYEIQYQTSSISGSTSYNLDITSTALDLAFGYRWRWLRPYLGIRREVYLMTADDPFVGSTVSSNLFGVGGLDFTIPIATGVGLSLRGDYASALVKDSTTKSADAVVAQVSLIWGLDQRK